MRTIGKTFCCCKDATYTGQQSYRMNYLVLLCLNLPVLISTSSLSFVEKHRETILQTAFTSIHIVSIVAFSVIKANQLLLPIRTYNSVMDYAKWVQVTIKLETLRFDHLCLCCYYRIILVILFCIFLMDILASVAVIESS